jgi:tetratricopeptide (TPR) repeat protein
MANDQPKLAELEYNSLLTQHFENHGFIKSCLRAKGCSIDAITPEDSAAAVAALDELFERLPKSLAVRRLTLSVARGDTFKRRASAYLTEFLTKGVPSLFVDIKALYSDLEKRAAVEEIVLSYKANLERTGTIDGSEGAPDPPTTLLWVQYFLAQHYSTVGRDAEALDLIDQTIAATPTLVELYMMKARILKRGGDLVAAERAMDEARQLDGQDRFLNCKAVKYMLRVGRIEEAEKVAGLFTRVRFDAFAA